MHTWARPAAPSPPTADNAPPLVIGLVRPLAVAGMTQRSRPLWGPRWAGSSVPGGPQALPFTETPTAAGGWGGGGTPQSPHGLPGHALRETETGSRLPCLAGDKASHQPPAKP